MYFPFFLSLSNYAQVFDTLYVIPKQANTDDSIAVISKVYFSKTPCPLERFSINIVDSTILIDANYLLGFGSGSCLSHDTIMIGKLNPNMYKLKYRSIDSIQSLSKEDSLYFTVNQVIGIAESNNPIQSVSVYPNPCGEAINLKVQLAKAVSTTIRITDVQGKIMHTEQVWLNKGKTVHAIKTKKLSQGFIRCLCGVTSNC